MAGWLLHTVAAAAADDDDTAAYADVDMENIIFKYYCLYNIC